MRRANGKPAKKSAAGPKRPKTKKSMPWGNPGLSKAICSITDPFCPGAVGSKIPDAAASKSLAWDAETWLDVTTDAQGRAGVFFGPDPANYSCAVTSWISPTNMAVAATSGTVSMPGFAVFSSTSYTYRVVSYGIQIRSVLSSMNNQGSLGIAVIPTDPDVVSTNVDFGAANLFSHNERGSMKDKMLTGIAGHDAVVQRTFKITSAPGANAMGSWGSEILAAYVTGGPASTVAMQIKVVYHFELVFPASTGLNAFASPTAQSNDTVLAGSNFVSKALGGVIKGGSEEVERRSMNAATAFGRYLARIGAGAVGGYFAGPSGALAGYQGAGMIMDVD